MRIVLTGQEYDQVRALLTRAAGLVFDDSRKESMTYSVAERMSACQVPDVASYLTLLDDPDERQQLLDEVTIQETHFFRNPPQVRALRQHVLPELLRHAEERGRRLRVWSAGCSTGEEPYSVAMLLRELLPASDGWDVKVVATDVSTRALAAARTGRYGPRALQMASPEQLGRFFRPLPDGGHEVRAQVRELVEFRHHNLVTEAVPFAPGERVDLVLCRNVTIYFGRDTTRSLMTRLHACLRDGGYLFLGHSETLWQVSEDFRLVALGTGEQAAFVYRRLDPVGERRAVLPDRRTLDEGAPPPAPERRIAPRRIAPGQVAPPEVEPTAALPDVDDVLLRCRQALAAGSYEQAAELAAAAGRLEPLRAECFYLRGRALVEGGRDEDALVDLRKAAYLEPQLGFAHFLLAGALDRLDHPEAAAVAYAAAADTLGLRPEDRTADELGGRSVTELAQLCRRLSEQHGHPQDLEVR